MIKFFALQGHAHKVAHAHGQLPFDIYTLLADCFVIDLRLHVDIQLVVELCLALAMSMRTYFKPSSGLPTTKDTGIGAATERSNCVVQKELDR